MTLISLTASQYSAPAFSGGRLAVQDEYPPFRGAGFEFFNPKTLQDPSDTTHEERLMIYALGPRVRVHSPAIVSDTVIITNDGQLPNRLGDVDAYRLLNERILEASSLLGSGKIGQVSVPRLDPQTLTIFEEKPQGKLRTAWQKLLSKCRRPAPSPSLYQAHSTLVSFRDNLKRRIVTEIVNPPQKIQPPPRLTFYQRLVERCRRKKSNQLP